MSYERGGWRWRIIRHTPTVLIDYLLEVLVAISFLLTAGAYWGGLTQSTSIIRLVPDWLAALWGTVIALGSLAVLVGLIIKKYGTVVATGMTMLGTASLVYAVSAVWYVGLFEVLASILMSIVFGLLALWRGFLLYSTYLYIKESKSGRPVPDDPRRRRE
jgi:hypothetical protein